MTSPRKRPLRRVGDLLPALAAQLGLEEELRLARAATTWRRLVEEQLPGVGTASTLLEIRPPTLVVSADDSATAQELRLRSSDLLEAFAAAPGGQRLLELRPVVGKRPRGGGADRARLGRPWPPASRSLTD